MTNEELQAILTAISTLTESPDVKMAVQALSIEMLVYEVERLRTILATVPLDEIVRIINRTDPKGKGYKSLEEAADYSRVRKWLEAQP